MKDSTKAKLKKYAPWFCIGAGALLLGVVIGKSNTDDVSRIISEAAKSTEPDDVQIFEGCLSPEFGKTMASLVLDGDFDPYTNIGKQICFSDDIGANFVVEIIQAG